MPHDTTIIPDTPACLWDRDATMAHTRDDGWVLAFVAVTHFTAEAWATVAKRGDRFAATEPIYDASGHFQGALRWLGVEASPSVRRRAPVEWVCRTVHPNAQGAVLVGPDVCRSR